MGDTRKLFSNSLILFAGTTLGSIFSYLFNMLMGRMLGPAQYGEMVALTSLIAIITVASGAILTVVMRYTGELYHQAQYAGIRRLASVFTRIVLAISLAIFLVSMLLIKGIAAALEIQSLLSVVIGFSSLFFIFAVVVNRGVLQGVQQFFSLSFISALEMGLRLLIGVVLVKAGLALNGALLAIVFASATAYFVTFIPLRSVLSTRQGAENEGSAWRFDRQEMVQYSIPTFLATLLLAVAFNADVLVVKSYSASEQAGLYAAISTIAKIILYLTAPIIAVMFPMISEKKTKGEKHYKTLFFSIFLTTGGALVMLGFYSIVPETVVRILYGATYIKLAYLLPQVGLYIVLYAIINLMINYFLAVRDFFFIWEFIAIILIEGLLITLNHGSIDSIIHVLNGSMSALLFLILIRYAYLKRVQVTAMMQGVYE